MKDHMDVDGQDLELASHLRFADPASGDANYWLRFQSWVLENAAPELARRRLMADLTVGDLLAAWARTLVPAAMLAAALAGLIVARSAVASRPAPLAVGVEELLVSGIEDETIPVTLRNDESATAVAFAGDRF
jgi:hypothetical protein